MLEEKTELFRAIQTKKEILKSLEKEISELRSQAQEPDKMIIDGGVSLPKRDQQRNRPLIQQEFEEIGIDQDELVPWTTILKETHGAGTLSSMTKPQKDRVDDAVYEFLALHMHPNDVKSCNISMGKKQIAALPPSMTDGFENWLGKSIRSYSYR